MARGVVIWNYLEKYGRAIVLVEILGFACHFLVFFSIFASAIVTLHLTKVMLV
ncbi:MAG: hypothetical protein ACFFER_18170 [Candidatus Thorarchaeota archaeon]